VSEGDDTEAYRFQPEDFEGGSDPTEQRLDPVPLALAGFIGIGGLLFLAGPVVDPLVVRDAELQAVVLSAVGIALGLLFGSGVYLRRGDRLLGGAHAVGGFGWTLVVLGTLLPSSTLLFAGLAVIIGGAVALVGTVSRR
jgi:hypothetical protein